jgi:hypothetical protein
LAKNEGLAGLRTLRVVHGNASGWTRAAPSLPGLRVLELESCGLTPADLKNLARSDCWGRLEMLGICISPLAQEGAAVFAAHPPARLSALDLSWCRLGPEGVQALAKSGGFRLRVLKLRHNAVKGVGLLPLVDAPCALGLEWLDVRGNTIDPRSLDALKKRFARLLY